MSSPRSRSSPEEELRLPRAPGVIRQFWARHPRVTDILIAAFCFILAVVPATTFSTGSGTSDGVTVTTGPTPLSMSLVTTAVIAASVLLVWRRRIPVVAHIGALVVAASYLSVALPVSGPLLLVTTYSLAVYRSSRASWLGYGVGVGALAVVALGLAIRGLIPFDIAWNAIVSQAVMGLIGALVGVNVGNRKRYMEAVIARSRQLLVERDQQAELAAAAERARIAREMHDIVSHSLTVVVALSEGAAATPDPVRARGAMEAVADTARSALVEMRAMLGVLRDESQAPLAPTEPVAPEVTVAAAQRAGYPVTLTVAGLREVSQPVRYAIGRIVQEGLTNAMRHAPTATSIAARVEYSDSAVVVTIRNDGVSQADAPVGGYGIRGLGERAAHTGGSLESGPIGEGQWLLTATLPDETTTARQEDAR